MTSTNNLAAILAPAVRAIHPPESMQRMRTTDLAIGQDGKATIHALGASVGHLVAAWYVAGALAVATNQTMQYRIAADGVVERFDLNVKTAPTGADLIVRLNQNGVSLGTTTIAAGDTSGGLSLDADCLAGDLLTIDITQAGSIVAGSDLSAFATYREVRGGS